MMPKIETVPAPNTSSTDMLQSFVSIIDDEESVRVALGSLVRSIGYPVKAFASAEEFLASEAVHRASCIVADIKMPGMDGIELYQLLKRRGDPQPFIFIAAVLDQASENRLADGDMVKVLEKPFDANELANFIEEAMS